MITKAAATPTHFSRRWLLAAAAASTVAPSAWAQGTPMQIKTAVTHGKASVRGQVIPYRAETGEIVLRNAAGTPRATMFAVSYLAEGANPVTRPVTFVWNGGPGGATWALREQLGPKIIARASTPTGFAFVNNPDSPIDVTDLVFIDAPGIGYSRMLADDAKSEYWGVEEDGRAFAEFIADWLKDHKRDASPKFLIGESYGGTRTAQVTKDLAARAKPILFRGITLVSPTLGNGTPDSTRGARAALLLPTEAATARFYERGAYTRLPLDQVVANAKQFADGAYADALRSLDHLDPAQKTKIAEQVSAFIGVPVQSVLGANLAVPSNQFRDLLLADKNERIGNDGRQHKPKPAPGTPPASVVSTAEGYDLSAALDSMYRDELKYTPAGDYLRDPVAINHAWNNKVTSEPASLPVILKNLMTQDPKMRVFLVGGYFDFTVPFSGPLNSLLAANLPADQFTHRAYPTGHGVFEDEKMRPTTTDDLRAFYKKTTA